MFRENKIGNVYFRRESAALEWLGARRKHSKYLWNWTSMYFKSVSQIKLYRDSKIWRHNLNFICTDWTIMIWWSVVDNFVGFWIIIIVLHSIKEFFVSLSSDILYI